MRIGIIGPIGAGKSTLSRMMAEYYGCPLMEEPVEKNEYLPYFYADKATFAMLSQNAFYSALFLSMWRLKDENNLVCDSTVYSNLVFTELLRLEGYMNATEVALTYAIADEHLKRIPDLDLQVVLVRSNEALFANVRKRSRVIEKGQEDYLNFHYNNYYKVLKRIYDNYRVPAKKILWLELGDVNEPKEFARVIKEIERAYNESK
ncbi:MAG: deoxynucleoside kinase [Bacilli bacterium]|jgi:deoxyadenosine/deoxycytidine kinase|nr:deoxynucleoside kinase [Bacilli bacterium]MCH4202061.1 deoxynucleoside kinase [Bacilli bacterium]MCH4236240.1 deoxynucleoside kinase [Bacilli bacterium]